MPRIDKTIEINAPVGVVYNQWTQFETYPSFMDGVEEVRQIDASRVYWSSNVSGVHREWYAHITRQVPDQVIAWETEAGAGMNGTVVFKPVNDSVTEVELHMDYKAGDVRERAGAMLGFVTRQIESDLHHLKEFIEERGYETGAWRGEIRNGRELPKAPLMDSSDAPEPELVQFGVSGMDALRNSENPAPDPLKQPLAR